MRILPSACVVAAAVVTIAWLGAPEAGAHCSLGPFDAAIGFSDHVWAGEIVDGRTVNDERIPFELTLQVDQVLNGRDPGNEVKIFAQPCRSGIGPAPSTLDDYIGMQGVFAIADIPTGYFYVETFPPKGDPIEAAEAVLASVGSGTSPPPTAVAPTPSPAAGTSGSASSAIPIIVAVIVLLVIAFVVLVRVQHRGARARARPPVKPRGSARTSRSARGQRKPTPKR